MEHFHKMDQWILGEEVNKRPIWKPTVLMVETEKSQLLLEIKKTDFSYSKAWKGHYHSSISQLEKCNWEVTTLLAKRTKGNEQLKHKCNSEKSVLTFKKSTWWWKAELWRKTKKEHL